MGSKPKRAGTIRPRHDYLLCKMLPTDKVSAGGIVLPDTRTARPDRAEVLAAGPGRLLDCGKRVEPQVKVGDVVYVDPYRFLLVLGEGQLANAEGTPYAGVGDLFFTRERDIRGVEE